MDYSVVTELIFAYASGDFSKKGEISERRDDLDMLIAGINMLGEELQATTVSRDYFISLYEAVSNMILVVDSLGTISNFNSNLTAGTGFMADHLMGKHIDQVLEFEHQTAFNGIEDRFRDGNKFAEFEGKLLAASNQLIPVKIIVSILKQKNHANAGYLFVIEDITEKLERESMVLRTIVETQETERKRVAEDLHDSLGQKLSAVKLYLNALGASGDLPPGVKSSVRKTKQIVDESIQDLRDIIFDQMPMTLETYGLKEALRELVTRLQGPHAMRFHLEVEEDIEELPKELNVVVYRLVQEFIQNTIKHSTASNLYIDILTRNNYLSVNLEDDGVGFDESLVKESSGRGLRNMITRVKAFHGQYNLRTSPGKGVRFTVLFKLAH